MKGTGPLLVSGATGLVGGHLVAALHGTGVSSRALTRRPDAASRSLPPTSAPVGWDGVRVPAEAISGARGVVHLAGEPIFRGRLTAERRRRARESRIASTRSLIETLAEIPAAERPAVLVCASAVGYYGDRGDEELREDAAAGEGFLADLCRDWEREAERARPHGLRVVTLRIGVVLARSGGALSLLAPLFRLGLGGRLGDGRQWFPWIHIDDLVSLVRACLEDDAWDGPVNAVSPAPVRNRDLTRALASAVHRPALFAVPGFALRAAMGELSAELLGSRRVLPGRAAERGFAFAHAQIESALEAELGR